MNKIIVLIASLAIISAILPQCKSTENKSPMFEEFWTTEELEKVAKSYGLEDMVANGKNKGLRFYPPEALHQEFKYEKERRDGHKIDSVFKLGIKSITSAADYENLLRTTPGKYEREKKCWDESDMPISFEAYLAERRNKKWHIYYEEAPGPYDMGTMTWELPEYDKGQHKGIRLDKNR